LTPFYGSNVEVSEGHKDDVDLSGVNVALVYTFPDKPSAGDWRVGIIADTESSEEQVMALETIFTGKDADHGAPSPGSSPTTWAFNAPASRTPTVRPRPRP
jgi:hypothetical protein